MDVSRDVAVTGMGAVTPLGIGADALYERWAAGVCAISDGCAACSDFDPHDHLSKRDVRATDRFAQLALVASAEAIEQAGWAQEPPYPSERLGCFIGTGIGGLHEIERLIEVLRIEGKERLSPLGITRLMGNAATGIVAMRFNLTGESYAVVSACAAGAQAIGTGLRMVRTGELDAVVVGGAEAEMTQLAKSCFEIMRGTSPSGISRPFDRRRDGFIPGEGAGVMVLENADLAAQRGAVVLGRLRGYGATTDAHHLAVPRPDGSGIEMAIRRALADADVEPREVVYVNPHGTSTPVNDYVETLAIKGVFGADAKGLKVSSTKSAIGHSQGAAGAVEAVATLLTLRAGVAPPTIGLEQPDDGFDLDYVQDVASPLRPPGPGQGRIGISNSFGLGGHNGVLVLEAV